MLYPTYSFRLRLAMGLGSVTLLGAADVSHADVTVVSQVVVTETVQPSLEQTSPLAANPPQRRESAHSPQKVTTYYKGGNVRCEVDGGTVALYDGTDGKITTLDPVQKTYYVRTVKDTLEPPRPSSDDGGRPGGGQPKVDSKIDLDKGEQTKTIAGTSALLYTVSGDVTVSRPQRGFGGQGGGRGGGGGRHHGGGGGFPGGGFPGGGIPLFQQGGFPGSGGSGDNSDGGNPDGGGFSRGSRAQSLEISGEVWLSDAVKLPDDKKTSVLPALQAAFSEGGLALKPLTDALNKKKDIPLDSRLTWNRTEPRTGAQDSVTTTTHVTSVSDAPLSDALFALPTGYTQVAPPAFDSFDSASDERNTRP